MATTVSIDEVTAPDASEHAAPHKISHKPTKNELTVKWTPTSSGPIGAYRVRLDPINRNTGTVLARAGMVCGTGDRCGTCRSLKLPSGTQVTEVITDTEVGAVADGGHEVKVFACAESDGWSS